MNIARHSDVHSHLRSFQELYDWGEIDHIPYPDVYSLCYFIYRLITSFRTGKWMSFLSMMLQHISDTLRDQLLIQHHQQ